MRARVVEWYNTYAELLGADRVELGVDEELTDLTLSDLSIAEVRAEDVSYIKALDWRAMKEIFDHAREELVAYYDRLRLAPEISARESEVLCAYDPQGEVVGFIWSVRESAEQAAPVVRLVQLYTNPDYRDLGVARALVTHVVNERHSQETIVAPWYASGEMARALFERAGFTRLGATYAHLPHSQGSRTVARTRSL